MTIKTAKKFMRMSALLGFVVLGSLSFNAAAAVISFGTGTAGFGGVVSFSPGGGDFTGTNINIGALTIAGSTSDGPYAVTNGVLSFSTVTGSLNIQGSVAGLGISSQTLLSGTMDDFFYGYSNGNILNFFSAAGSSVLSTDLLSAIGLSGTGFDYLAYTIDVNSLGQVVDAGVVNTTSVVPLPAAAWLFGSAILGLLGIARRKKA